MHILTFDYFWNSGKYMCRINLSIIVTLSHFRSELPLTFTFSLPIYDHVSFSSYLSYTGFPLISSLDSLINLSCYHCTTTWKYFGVTFVKYEEMQEDAKSSCVTKGTEIMAVFLKVMHFSVFHKTATPKYFQIFVERW